MKETPQNALPPVSLEENLKKATTELLMLQLLARREYYIGELTEALHQRSDGALSVVFPYSAVYRLLQAEYITESKKRSAPDGRRRQYYQITPAGKEYLERLLEVYRRFTKGVTMILEERENDG